MELILVLGAFIIGLTLVLITVPPVLKVARTKCLFEPFDERKIHKGSIPSFGGVAIFIGFVLSTIIATDGYSFDELKYIIAAVILMFFVGLKDDLIVISARKKLAVQIFAAILLITLGNVKFTNIHGIMGNYEIHYFTGLLLSLFTMIVIINAFNLIDGIDGLASGLAILSASVFGTWFYLSGHIQFSIMSFALVGSLAGFFLYNVFGHRNKLFMGDTGSLIIGLIISTLAIKFNEFNIDKSLPYSINAAPAVSFAIIIVPLVDTLRVMTIRILEGRSPFSPDKNHIHHRLLYLTPNHLKVTLTIMAGNAFMVGLAFLLNSLHFNITIQFILVVFSGILFSFVPSMIVRHVQSKERKDFAEQEVIPKTKIGKKIKEFTVNG